MDGIIPLAKKYNLGLVATNDAHYLKKRIVSSMRCCFVFRQVKTWMILIE